MNAEGSWVRFERQTPAKLGGQMAYITSQSIEGDEEERFDQEVQALSRDGFHIIDKHLVIDKTQYPPVWGWICYRETTDAERRVIRSGSLSYETEGQRLP